LANSSILQVESPLFRVQFPNLLIGWTVIKHPRIHTCNQYFSIFWIRFSIRLVGLKHVLLKHIETCQPFEKKQKTESFKKWIPKIIVFNTTMVYGSLMTWMIWGYPHDLLETNWGCELWRAGRDMSLASSSLLRGEITAVGSASSASSGSTATAWTT
jgi:hypothetical protein